MKEVELSSKDLEVMFGCTTMTVVNYRRGSPKISPLPAYDRGRGIRNRIYFMADEVIAWATENNITINTSVNKILQLRNE